MNNDELQKLYNQTKELNSPQELDDLILNQIRDDFNPAIKPEREAKNSPVFFAIAASTILAVTLSVFMLADEIEIIEKPLEIAKTNSKNGQQLPLKTYYPFASKNEIVLMCGKLPRPERDFKWKMDKKPRDSKLPELAYPYDLKQQAKPSVFCKRLNDTNSSKIELACGIVPAKKSSQPNLNKSKTSSLPKLNYPYQLEKIPKANVLCKLVEKGSDKLVCGLVTTKPSHPSNASQLPELKYPYSKDKHLDPESLCKQILKHETTGD